MTAKEIFVIACVGLVVVMMAAQSMVPALKGIDRAGLMLTSTLLFFIFGVLKVQDLEEMPWNIILLFSGAMSIGFCLWKTGAAEWMAVNWLAALKDAHWWVFVMGIAAFVLVMTNFIMNVAAIAIALPVSLVIARYLGVAPDVIFFASLVTAGMPFVLLIGAAPNAIAYESKQFTPGEFFKHGLAMSAILLVVLGLAHGHHLAAVRHADTGQVKSRHPKGTFPQGDLLRGTCGARQRYGAISAWADLG